MILLHAAKQIDYENSLNVGYYGDFSIENDGFIHCSKIEDLVNVANDNLKDIKDDLVISFIDTDRLTSKVKWGKRGKIGIEFPHVYGLISMDAAVNVIPFLKDENGKFLLPKQILEYKNKV